jgi:hypothetical protein
LKRGHFEDLEQVMAFGWNRRSDADVSSLTAVSADDGILEWPHETREKLNAAKGVKGSIREKRLTLIAYLFELTYDLSIGKYDNVSESPGFESFGLRAAK